MLRSCASFCTNFLMRHSSLITETRKPIYVYGFELILSTLSSMVSILLLSALLSKFLTAVLFILIFYGFRFFCGGYHAKSYVRCFFSTNITYMCTFLLATGLEYLNHGLVQTILLLISVTIVIIFAPIKNEEHPISEAANKKNRKIALSLTLLLLISYFIMSVLNCPTDVLSILSSSITAVAVLMVIPKLFERRKSYD